MEDYNGEPLPQREGDSNGAANFAMPRVEDGLLDLTKHFIEAGRDNLAVRFDTYDQPQLKLLFGELAMHLAGVESPEDAASPDWVRGIIEAMRRISTTPAMFEGITGAPYAHELVQGIGPEPVRPLEHDKAEVEIARALQKAVNAKGYLRHDMLPTDHLIQLEYTAAPNLQKQRKIRRTIPPEGTINIKLRPYENEVRGWNVKQYKRWDSQAGYRGYTGTRRRHLNEVFLLMSADASAAVPKQLMELANTAVRIGEISLESQLRLEHTFITAYQEVPGHETKLSNRTLVLPMALKQAYLGSSRDFPLFPLA